MLEWIQFHNALGFDIALYDHHSSNPNIVLPTSGVDFIPFPPPTGKATQKGHLKDCLEWKNAKTSKEHGFTVCQLAAYYDCLKTYSGRYTWISNIDIDEFIFHTSMSSSMFWSVIQTLGDSVQLQCLKFGPQRSHASLYHSSRSTTRTQYHIYRAPYSHLGESNDDCQLPECESVGSEKVLSKSSVLLGLNVHNHVLTTSARSTAWQSATENGIKCHHYAFGSLRDVEEKAARNQNSFILRQSSAGLFAKDAWFNRIQDFSLVTHTPLDVCIVFLSCRRLEKLKKTYSAMMSYMKEAEGTLSFATVIVDNGSGQHTQEWIQHQSFNKSILLHKNVGIAKAMDAAWNICFFDFGSAFILNVEDDWIASKRGSTQPIRQAMDILYANQHVLEVWLRPHADEFQFEPGTFFSRNGQFQRTSVIEHQRGADDLAYYVQNSTKSVYPWWGAYTNGASLKHSLRLRSLGSMYQSTCEVKGNCEAEFASRAVKQGWHAARLCWLGDACNTTFDNEPESSVLFVHQSGERSPGHQELYTK